MRIALIQLDPVWENPERNHNTSAQLLRAAASDGADVAVLPEMFSTGFSFDLQRMDVPDKSPTHEFLSQTASRLGINIIAGFKALSPDGKGLNLARAYSRDGRVISTYEKIHPFTFAGEHNAFAPGTGPVVFEMEGIPSSMFICYDLRFPEDFRKVARNVLLIFVLANWPSSRHIHWESLLRARAIENQCFVAGVNRTGRDEKGIEYSGGSLVFGPQGEELARSPRDEGIISVEFDPAMAVSTREQFPFLEDMHW